MPTKTEAPSEAELKAILGSAAVLWFNILHAVGEMFTPLEKQWRPTRTAFGRMCLVQHKKRTLLYLTPDRGKVWIAIILGERAYNLAMSSSIPAAIKRMFAEARPYSEGRGIRYPVDSLRAVPVITKLLEIKTTPK
jgi:hypothetical protein